MIYDGDNGNDDDGVHVDNDAADDDEGEEDLVNCPTRWSLYVLRRTLCAFDSLAVEANGGNSVHVLLNFQPDEHEHDDDDGDADDVNGYDGDGDHVCIYS